MWDIHNVRRFYAEEIRAVANLRSEALVAAFAKVPREHFLGPGPWQISSPGMGDQEYRTTPDADPVHLYHNILIAIDESRQLNNGQPSFLAYCLEALELREGERVLHIGCGVGYYTAIIAETVGASGCVIGVEIDADLAARSRENLAYLKQAEVWHGDGAEYGPGECDAIFINAGVTHLKNIWLDSMRPGGRLLLYLTATFDPGNTGRGGVLLVKRIDHRYAAHFISQVGVYHCIGARDEESNQRLIEAMKSGRLFEVKSLRREHHERDDSCLLHHSSFCLSSSPMQ